MFSSVRPVSTGAAALRRLCLSLQGEHAVARIVPGHRRHPRPLGRGQLDQVRPAAGGDDQVGLQSGAGGLHQHVDAQLVTAAAGGIADDPAYRVAGGDRHQFLAGLQGDHRHAAWTGIDLIERAVGEGPDLNRVDVAFACGRHACFRVGEGYALARVFRLGRRRRLVLQPAAASTVPAAARAPAPRPLPPAGAVRARAAPAPARRA